MRLLEKRTEISDLSRAKQVVRLAQVKFAACIALFDQKAPSRRSTLYMIADACLPSWHLRLGAAVALRRPRSHNLPLTMYFALHPVDTTGVLGT